MEWELVKPWVNRVGVVLEFLSFWLAAPEILGEARLRALERRVEDVVRVFPAVVTGVFVMVWLLTAIWRVRFDTELLMGWRVGGIRSGVIYTASLILTLISIYLLTLYPTRRVLTENIVRPLLLKLADDQRIRQRSLAVGAVLFVVGFLLQLLATF